MRRLPTSVFTLVAVLVITLGAGWWVSAEPPAQQAATSSRVVLDLGNGKILTYLRARDGEEVRQPCRPARRTPYTSVGERRGLAAAPSARTTRYSRCARR